MIIRIARIFMLALAFNLILGLRPAIGDESPSPNLSPDGQTNTKKTPLLQNKPKPSTLNKITTGPKKFFSSIGNALTFKKSAPQKTTTIPTNPWIKPAKEEPKPSWLASIFHKEEPQKQKSPSEWLQQERMNP
ncbi:MAG: hypothetical protein ABSA26_06005 [Thermoguttaceae bacterium]|jgi:hypothetical protein